jgi:hypothetical protein
VTKRPRLRALSLLLVLATGCATLGDRDARRLRDEADALLAARDEEAAYRRLALIRTRHPDSPEAREVFPAAAIVFKRQWWKRRYSEPESPWLTTEPAFLFAWLESLAGDGFPQQDAERLLVGMPYGFFEEYVAFAATSPTLGAWQLEVEKDNGILEAIRPSPAPPPDAD